MASAVVGVVGGSGGAGASTFAAALAAGVGGPAVLVDLDRLGGGIDTLLGIEAVPGARWSQLQLGGGRLDPLAFEQGLPRWGDVRVLADPADGAVTDIAEVLAAARSVAPVVLDVGRCEDERWSDVLSLCDLVVVVVVGTVSGIAAARRVLGALPDVSVGALLRRGSVREADAAELLGVPVLTMLPDALRQDTAVPQAWTKVGQGVFAGLLAGVE